MRKIYVCKLKPGMILAKSVYGPNGQLWLRAGVTLTSQYISSLLRSKINFVYVLDPFLSDAQNEEIVSDQARLQANKLVKNVLTNIKQGKQGPIVDNNFLKVVNRLVEEVLDNKDVMYNLADILSTDEYTFNHSVNVCILSLLIASNLRYTRSRLQDIAVGALLHDLGKTKIDKRILMKEGCLTNEEFAIIKMHPVLGADILSCRQRDLADDSLKIVLQHHERCDGSGYPHQLLHHQINESARLVMIVDVYDALTSDRPYRAALQPHQVLSLLKYSGNHAYDPVFLQTFFEHVPAYPVGTALRLSNGDIGLVVKNKVGKTFSPTVRVYWAEGKGPYKNEFEIDLAVEQSIFVEEVLSEEKKEELFPLYPKNE